MQLSDGTAVSSTQEAVGQLRLSGQTTMSLATQVE